ncbi:MAG: GntR family transcriptional regulator [Lachnospiraceae bacterium]|nr:GntR family transcriptional regulator [Lachnospiraceae bacterium]
MDQADAGKYKINYAEWVFDDVNPVYAQLRDNLKCSILSGQLQPGESIPSIREMSSILRISANTVARAYRLIKAEGLIDLAEGSIYRIISDNIAIQKIRAQEVRMLCCNYIRGMITLGFDKKELLTLFEFNVQRYSEHIPVFQEENL